MLVSVLKRKRSEWWIWVEAARVHRGDQPELALACFCHALRIGREPTMMVKAHIELAQMLAEDANVAQASREAAIATEVYDQEGWRHPPELAALLQSDWYDPTLDAEDPSQFYAQHADEALQLCFDKVHEVPATYLGVIERKDGKKPMPLFGLKFDDVVVSCLGRRHIRGLTACATGAPLSLLVGVEGDRRDILEAVPRPDGAPWDCLDTQIGVIAGLAADGGGMHIYLSQITPHLFAAMSTWPAPTVPAAGEGIRVWCATNPVRNYIEVHHVAPGPLPENGDIATFSGHLRRHTNGFGFVEDVYVPRPLIESLSQESTDVTVVAIMAYDKPKDRHSWRAVAITPCA